MHFCYEKIAKNIKWTTTKKVNELKIHLKIMVSYRLLTFLNFILNIPTCQKSYLYPVSHSLCSVPYYNPQFLHCFEYYSHGISINSFRKLCKNGDDDEDGEKEEGVHLLCHLPVFLSWQEKKKNGKLRRKQRMKIIFCAFENKIHGSALSQSLAVTNSNSNNTNNSFIYVRPLKNFQMEFSIKIFFFVFTLLQFHKEVTKMKWE